ncbi:MAG: TIGR00268 family protein [Lentisphaerae bacterium GWF2_52_8]|nr:MAG: TIGR00268 family protein [Lentisphaerae bacterium GWF2_52_8]
MPQEAGHTPAAEDLLSQLEKVLSGCGRLAVACSGGADSTLLASAAVKLMGRENVLLLHVKSCFSPDRESDFFETWTAASDLQTKIIHADPLGIPEITRNDARRCYHCKKFIFSRLLQEAEELGFAVLADGTNLDDFNDYRPGLEASAELGIGHPLAEAGFGKREIRILAKHLGLANWNAPAAACLASRIPCDTALDEKSLALVSSAEDFLCGLGFPECRVRKLGTLAKIEVGTHHLAILWEKRETVNERLRTLGFKSVAIDLAGYQQGAMNNLICKPSGLDS